MPTGGPGSKPGGGSWVPARDRTDARSALRIILGLFFVFVAILAVLAFLNSFFVQPQQGPITPTPNPGPSTDPGGRPEGGGGNVTCDDVVSAVKWTFIGLSSVTVIFLAVAVVRRHANQGRVLTNLWGILAIIFLVLSLVALGAWRFIDWSCNGFPTCKDLINGSYVTFVVLLIVSLASVGFGITFAHMRQIGYFKTGIGVLAVVAFLPMIITGIFWYFLRIFCDISRISCTLRLEMMDNLSLIYWFSFLLGAAAIGVGFWYKSRFKRGLFTSGWGVLAVLLLLLAALAGAGYVFIKNVYIPICDPTKLPEEQEVKPPKCEDILSDIATYFWWSVALFVVLVGAGLWFNRKEPKKFFSSLWGIGSYVVLGIVLIIGLIYLVMSSLCNAEGENVGQGGTSGGPSGTTGGQGGTGGTNSGNPGGGGNQNGGGGGGVGSGAPRPVIPNPQNLAVALGIIGAIIAAVLLLMLLRRRKALGLAGGAAFQPPAQEVQASEQATLMQILAKRELDSSEAIIAAYRVFLAWSAGRGFSKQPNETPREHSRRVLEEFKVPEQAMVDFIRAYEVARLSSREPTMEERKLAVQFSREILKGPPQGGAP